jgi:AcrR family transcriptional regulator
MDASGLAALSMHKLGAELGVKAMSLYYYVQNKDDVLDGVAGLLWSEIDADAIEQAGWQAATRLLAGSLRDVVHRHPHAAPLLMGRQVVIAAMVRVQAAYLEALRKAGFTRGRGLEVLRIVLGFGLGYAIQELSWRSVAASGSGRPGSTKPTPGRRMIGSPEELSPALLEVAADVCRGSDTAAHFELGLDLMLRGLESGA